MQVVEIRTETRTETRGERYEQNRFVDLMSKVLRPLNFVGGVGTIATAVFVLLYVGFNFQQVLNLYFTSLLGLLLLAGDLNLRPINENCKFLITLLGRGLYDIFVGGWVYSLRAVYVPNDPDRSFDNIIALITYVVYLVTYHTSVFFYAILGFILRLWLTFYFSIGSLDHWWFLHLLTFLRKEQVHLRHPKVDLISSSHFR